MEKIKWCIEQHRKTNHMYDETLPYEFHLRMVNNVYKKFSYLLDNTKDYFTKELKSHSIRSYEITTLREACEIACWGHDIIEDTRNTYNDVKFNLGQEAAEIIYAVTNEKGKSRKDRANEKYYEGIRNTQGAVFVKLCDRIANVEYSKMMGSRQYDMYRKENEEFIKNLGDHEYSSMVDYLKKIFE